MDTFDSLPPILRRVIANASQQIDIPSVADAVRQGHDPVKIAAVLMRQDEEITRERQPC